ncbi:hypothetical protein Cantr_05345 [Candida viswanathii]|uniref:Uncharacterized protein n=1 Tax=Candida viswanathii TaxID=5486 RepID=A0A367XTI2_9ASCO|nr:hypothetical protein Cantr_05345 [Candida viswanathii]
MPVPTSTLISSDSESSGDEAPQRINWEQQRLEQEARRRRAESQRIGSPFKHPWWSPYCDAGPTPRCLDEWLTTEISYSIRCKPDWESKYKNEEIVKKWIKEIRDQCQDKTKYLDQIIEYVFKELEWYERMEKDLGGFKVGCEDKILFSDAAVAEPLKKEFVADVAKLVASFDGNFDYHPGSDQAVVDLVHPSLFVVQYDKTPVLRDGNLSIVHYHEEIEHAKANVDASGVSKRFQWLPSLMTKNSSGQFEFDGYINNLHPVQYKDLYDSIGKIFNAAIPGLNCALTRYASKEHIRIPIPRYNDAYTEEYTRAYDELEAQLEREAEAEGVDMDYDRLCDFENTKAQYLREFIPKWEGDPEFDSPIDLADFENLKVIVKLADIELTPERPSYAGGSWHVEGTINEDIVATVLYYYDIENIVESKLSFRTGYEDPAYEQGDSVYTEVIFGIHDEDRMVRQIGDVEANENRMVVFPNMFQHHVDPFELKDKTKPGHRRILCFFVVDPFNDKVLTTSQVPPQNKAWWDDPALDYLFPNNLKLQILELKRGESWPMTLNEAKSVRVDLMDERSFVEPSDYEYDEGAFTRTFSLCEH